MPSAWTQNFYHAVFSTKRRVAHITPEIESRLHPFIGGILKDLNCTPLAINGTPDHLHLLARYPSDLSHSDLLRHVKSRSSRWVHETFAQLSQFQWQEGYGGFTVSKSMAETVAAYIDSQKEHHKTMSFKEEYLKLLRLHGIDEDEAELLREWE